LKQLKSFLIFVKALIFSSRSQNKSYSNPKSVVRFSAPLYCRRSRAVSFSIVEVEQGFGPHPLTPLPTMGEGQEVRKEEKTEL
jgi:hypothetical protein